MYTLYFSPDACSLATQVVLHELDQPVKIANKDTTDDFAKVNPVGAVPVLVDGQEVLREGAAIMLYLLNKHPSSMMPSQNSDRQRAIQNIMFANATMHPAYSRLFFIAQQSLDTETKLSLFTSASENITSLWKVVESQLDDQPFLGGQQVSAADIMLAVYCRWASAFPIDIVLGEKSQAMVNRVLKMPNFQRALDLEAAA